MTVTQGEAANYLGHAARRMALVKEDVRRLRRARRTASPWMWNDKIETPLLRANYRLAISWDQAAQGVTL